MLDRKEDAYESKIRLLETDIRIQLDIIRNMEKEINLYKRRNAAVKIVFVINVAVFLIIAAWYFFISY